MTAPALKLVALDEEDLAVVSACVQDAVVKVGDLSWRPAERRFVATMNRFAWEAGETPGTGERRRACMHFDRVVAVRSQNIARSNAEAILSLLAVTFTETAAPAGTVELVFAGGGAIRLDVECVEAQLADLGAAWSARARPAHDAD